MAGAPASTEGHVAELMIVKLTTLSLLQRQSSFAEILLFEGDTCAADDMDSMMEDEQCATPSRAILVPIPGGMHNGSDLHP